MPQSRIAGILWKENTLAVFALQSYRTSVRMIAHYMPHLTRIPQGLPHYHYPYCEIYFMSIARYTVTISSYNDDGIRKRFEIGADGVHALL